MKNSVWMLFILMLGLGSCEDALDLKPEYVLTFKNAIETEKDLEAVLDGVGSYVKYTTVNYSTQISKGEYMSKELYGFNHAARTLSPDGGVVDGMDWTRYYLPIAQANVILEFAGQARTTETRRQMYMGQACFYKGLMYLELIRRWGDVVLVKNEVNLEPQGQSPWTEVCDYAIEMAQYAADHLPEFPAVIDHQGRTPRYKSTPCKGAAYALLAHLCAWKAGGKYFAADANYDEMELWKRARAACDSVINSGIYDLEASPELVCTSVLVGDSKESVYETVYKDLWHEIPENDRSMYAVCFSSPQKFPVEPNSTPNSARTNNWQIYLSEMAEMYPGTDERRNAYFYKFDVYNCPDSVEVTGGLAFPNKWRFGYIATTGYNAGRMINYNQNKIWWRLADIILLRGECAARLGDDAAAIADINTIRERANAKLYETAEYDGDVRYAVFKEREKELLFEGTRYYDIIRNGYYKTELEGNFRTASEQDFRDGAFFLVIREYSFQNNPALRQNKYWSKFL